MILRWSLTLFLLSLPIGACCGDEVRAVGVGVGAPDNGDVSLAPGDTVRLVAAAVSRADGTFPTCSLYSSDSAPERFEFSVHDTAVARLLPFGRLVAVRPGSTSVVVQTAGVNSPPFRIEVLSGDSMD